MNDKFSKNQNKKAFIQIKLYFPIFTELTAN
jgi:hypothetical protein